MESDPNTVHLDVLRRLFALQTYCPVISKRTKRASIALIIRVRSHNDPIAMQPSIILPKKLKVKKSPKPPSSSISHKSQRKPSGSTGEAEVVASPLPQLSSDFNQEIWISQPWVRNGDLELMYMRRAANPNDRWSGQVAFPGGRKAKGESDYQTAVRETKEEVGLDLNDTSSFQFICRLNDLQIDPFRDKKPLNVCSFVFLQISQLTPPLALEPSEVSSIVWCPFAFFGASIPPGWSQSPSTAIRNLPLRFFKAIGGAPQGMQGNSLRQGRWSGSPLPWQELNYLSYYRNQTKAASAPLINSVKDQFGSQSKNVPAISNESVTVLTTGFGVKRDIPSDLKKTEIPSTSDNMSKTTDNNGSSAPETDEQLTEEESQEIAAVFKTREERLSSVDSMHAPSEHTLDDNRGGKKGESQSTEQASFHGSQRQAEANKSHHSQPWLPMRLTFPALHLPGVGIDCDGTVFSSQGSPQFLLWGFTLRTTGQLFRLLDVPYVDEHVRRGNAQRRRNLNMYHRYIELRGLLARQTQRTKDFISTAFNSTKDTILKAIPEDQSTPRRSAHLKLSPMQDDKLDTKDKAAEPLQVREDPINGEFDDKSKDSASSSTSQLNSNQQASSPNVSTHKKGSESNSESHSYEPQSSSISLANGRGIVVHGQHSSLVPLTTFRSSL